jgi:hypothetical protein
MVEHATVAPYVTEVRGGLDSVMGPVTASKSKTDTTESRAAEALQMPGRTSHRKLARGGLLSTGVV